jgi:hypothetical protein
MQPSSYELEFFEDFNIETKLLNKFIMQYDANESQKISGESFIFDYNFGQPLEMKSFSCEEFASQKETFISSLDNYPSSIDDQYFKNAINAFSMIKNPAVNDGKAYCIFVGTPFNRYTLKHEYVYMPEVNTRFKEGEYYVDFNYAFKKERCRGEISYNRKIPVGLTFQGDFLEYNGSKPECEPRERKKDCIIMNYSDAPDKFGITINVSKEATNSGVFYIDFNCAQWPV